jgi:hypothetical protein
MRIIVASHALWIMASRPDLPSVVSWPDAFWAPIGRRLLLRFFYFGLHPLLERILYVALLIALVGVILGFGIRITALAAGFLLYHFAPLDALLASGDFVSMGGLTIPTIAMFLIWAVDRAEAAESSDYRWPVVLCQLLLASSFLLSGIMKLSYVGLHWYTASNIGQAALTNWSLSGRPAALWVSSSTLAAWAIAIGSAVLDVLFVPAVFSSRIRWIALPLALVATLVRKAVFGVFWLAAPLLLLFIDWDAVFRRSFADGCADRRFLRV